ncbi:MAG: hypothetical protein ACM3P1_04045 [Candidatus Saccharibacteria bacterium]
MARVTNEISSSLSGKAYGQVYVHLNGQTYTRSLPHYKKDSITKGMLQNQTRFKRVNEFCSLFKDSVIPQIWKGVNPKMSGYALFLKTNMAAFGPDGSLQDAGKIQLSTGKLSFPQGLEAKRMETNSNRVEVSWPRQMHIGGAQLKDELMVICSYEGQYTEILATGIVINDLAGTFALPLFSMPLAPSPMHVYLFFASSNRRDYSPSVCFEV